jgi:hypothetical protein
MADTRRNLHQLLKGKQLYSALYGVYIEALHNLKPVLKETAAKGETAKTTITAPSSTRNSGNKDESRNLHMMPTKEPTNLQHPPQEWITPNCSQSLNCPPTLLHPSEVYRN